MNISYIQPEANITDLARRERGARLECERLAAQIESTIKRAIALAALIAVSACSGLASDDAEKSQSIDDTAPVPVAVAQYDCVPSPHEQMGASPDTTATCQIWLDGEQLYTCHSNVTPKCPGFGGTPIVYDCRTRDLQ